MMFLLGLRCMRYLLQCLAPLLPFTIIQHVLTIFLFVRFTMFCTFFPLLWGLFRGLFRLFRQCSSRKYERKFNEIMVLGAVSWACSGRLKNTGTLPNLPRLLLFTMHTVKGKSVPKILAPRYVFFSRTK
jgi:hypothetical protein